MWWCVCAWQHSSSYSWKNKWTFGQVQMVHFWSSLIQPRLGSQRLLPIPKYKVVKCISAVRRGQRVSKCHDRLVTNTCGRFLHRGYCNDCSKIWHVLESVWWLCKKIEKSYSFQMYVITLSYLYWFTFYFKTEIIFRITLVYNIFHRKLALWRQVSEAEHWVSSV